MSRDFLFFIAGAVLSGLFSWLFTDLYYRKSLKEQERASGRDLSRMMGVVSQAVQGAQAPGAAAAQVLLRQQRIEECIAEYKRAGTPVRVIDTYNDLGNYEKAELLDTVLLRVRGRPARDNKYRHL